jgi:kynurenine formamidase
MAKARTKATIRKSAPKAKQKPALKTKAPVKAKAPARAKPTPKARVKMATKPRPRVAAKAKVRARRPARASSGSAPVVAPMEPRPIPADVPDYERLPIREGAPAGAAWGVFGDDDQLGTINLLTPDRVRQAAAFIRGGRVFALNLPINIPDPPLFTRGKHSHTIKKFAGHILDDYLDNFYPQASSQWDALCHVKHPRFGGYNGVPDSEITGYGGAKLGIDNLARRGIAGRGILADIGRYYERIGKTLDYTTNDVIPFDDLLATLEAQGTQVWPGDVLLVRIGWTRAYLALTPEEKERLSHETKSPGIEGSARAARWLWDNHIAAVGGDSPALEVMPPPRNEDLTRSEDWLHFHMLSFFGMPIGEMWNLEELAEDCADDRRYEFFFTSAPLNIPGGVGSPPNALAIK